MTIEEDVVAMMKGFAEEENRSFSRIIEQACRESLRRWVKEREEEKRVE